jgi:formylmethanofuran dehydrogenase subunit E
MDFDDIVQFHGHSCPGVAIGYRMTLAAMAALGVSRSGDEELVAIVETDSCGVDALQFISGCTFGKGNLIFHDQGKPVFTLYSRSSNKGIRVRFRDEVLPEELRSDRAKKLAFILAAPEAAIIALSEPLEPLPAKARIVETAFCAACGEPVMATRLVDGLCPPCSRQVN